MTPSSHSQLAYSTYCASFISTRNKSKLERGKKKNNITHPPYIHTYQSQLAPCSRSNVQVNWSGDNTTPLARYVHHGPTGTRIGANRTTLQRNNRSAPDASAPEFSNHSDTFNPLTSDRAALRARARGGGPVEVKNGHCHRYHHQIHNDDRERCYCKWCAALYIYIHIITCRSFVSTGSGMQCL